MNRSLTLSLFVSAILALSTNCNQSRPTLSRERAAEIVRAGIPAPAVETRTIDGVYLKYDGEYFLNQSGYPPNADVTEIDFLLGRSALYPKPLMTETELAGSPYKKIELSPTDQGQPFVIRRTQFGDYEVRICQRAFGEVTGIQLGDQASTAHVEYSLKAEWTPFGLFYKTREPQEYPELSVHTVELRLYDDGWRLVK